MVRYSFKNCSSGREVLKWWGGSIDEIASLLSAEKIGNKTPHRSPKFTRQMHTGETSIIYALKLNQICVSGMRCTAQANLDCFILRKYPDPQKDAEPTVSMNLTHFVR
jgi:hypothetical protein